MDQNLREPEQTPPDILESLIPKQKREAIGRDAKWTAIGIALFTLLGQQIVLNSETITTLYSPFENYLKPGVASLGDYITIWNTFVVSAPLVVAFSIIWGYGSEKLRKQEGFAAGHYWIAAILLWVAAWIGNQAGFTPVRSEGLRGGTPYAWVAFMLGDYLNAYGVVLFLSSLAVGIFVSRAWKTVVIDQ